MSEETVLIAVGKRGGACNAYVYHTRRCQEVRRDETTEYREKPLAIAEQNRRECKFCSGEASTTTTGPKPPKSIQETIQRLSAND